MCRLPEIDSLQFYVLKIFLDLKIIKIYFYVSISQRGLL